MNRVVVGLVAVLASVTLLHKGRTDSNGGHYDRSSGEYHYHHGYSAHDHYDMNGDGIVDCPYNFKDNTSKSESKTNSVSKSSGNGAGNIMESFLAIALVIGVLMVFLRVIGVV